jgi:YD repeat-containing protein
MHETILRMSTLAKEEYAYDSIGRLTHVNETPTGKGCKTRLYAYDEDSNRLSQTTRSSETETCATSGGTTVSHSYDSADRLIDSGAVVAADILAGTGGAAGIIAVLGGGSFTAGCELGSSSNRTYISGLPSYSSGCYNVWTKSKRTGQYTHRQERCNA